MKIKKTNIKEVVKKFKKAAEQKSDIKPIFKGVNVSDSVEEEKWLACTDTFRFHAMKYTLIKSGDLLPPGTYNLDTLELIEEPYPDYKKIIHTQKVAFEGALYNLKDIIQKQGLKNVKENTVSLFGNTVNKKYMIEAIDFLWELNCLHKGIFSEVKVYISANKQYKPLNISMYSDDILMAYALIMPRTD